MAIAIGDTTAYQGGAVGTHDVPLPTAAVGDYMVMALVGSGNTTLAVTGWTELAARQQSVNILASAAFGRVVDGAEGSTATVTTSNGRTVNAVVVAFSGVDSTPMDATPTADDAQNHTLIVPALTTVTDGALSLALPAGRPTGTPSVPSNYTLDDISAGSESWTGVYSMPVPTAGSVAAVTFSGTTVNNWCGIHLALRPAPSSPATGTASTSWAASTSAVGSAPAVPLNTGTASTTWTATASATGDAPTVPVSEGTASTPWQAAASAEGSAPAVGLHEGTASLSWPAVASAVGSSPAVPVSTGEASTTWAATATAVGESPAVAMHSGTATTSWEADASATGEHPKPKRNLTLSDTAPALIWSDTGPTRAWADGGPGADGWTDEAPTRVWSDQLLGR